MNDRPVIAIVVPCYNEEEMLPISMPRIKRILTEMIAEGMVSTTSYILCCNDGSSDGTWELIEGFHEEDPIHIKGLSLACNRGHQNVLLAGLHTVTDKCDAAISIDADLQDDPEAIKEMIREFATGKDIVFGVRASRATDTWFKRNSARAFYALQHSMGLKTVYDHADYRLMSNRALQQLGEYGEVNMFLRGIVVQLGLETAIVKYDRAARVAGESKYPLKKMLNLSIDGITSFSPKPIRLIFSTGLVLLLLDIIVAIYVLLSYFGGEAVSGWSSIMLSVWFLGSLILMAIGVVGEYIGKIFMEVKHRPRYAVRDLLWD